MTTITQDPKIVLTEELALAHAEIERLKNDELQHFPEAASIGETVRQGDIYIQLIDDVTTTPLFYREVTAPAFPFQLAIGNTKGSRHCLEHGDGVKIYTPIDSTSAQVLEILADMYGIDRNNHNWSEELWYTSWAESQGRRAGSTRQLPTLTGADTDVLKTLMFSGPIMVLTEPNKIVHPEHGDWALPGMRTYRIVYQRTVARDNSVMRVLD